MLSHKLDVWVNEKHRRIGPLQESPTKKEMK